MHEDSYPIVMTPTTLIRGVTDIDNGYIDAYAKEPFKSPFFPTLFQDRLVVVVQTNKLFALLQKSFFMY